MTDATTIHGRCRCGLTTFTTAVQPNGCDACHCNACKANSPTFDGGVIFGNFPNNTINVSTPPDRPLTVKQTSHMGGRVFCPGCNDNIWMRYHCGPNNTSVNLGFVVEDNLRISFVESVTDRIFIPEEELQDIQKRHPGTRCYIGFNPEFEANLKRWEEEGSKKRDDT